MGHAPLTPTSAEPDIRSASTSPSVVAQRHNAEIAIVGGGLSGSLAAVVLGRAGYRVALIDRHAIYPAEFRVEKIAGDQVELIRRLGLLDALASVSTPFDQVLNIRHGEILDRSNSQHFGVLYEDLVRAVRAQLPASVTFHVGRVVDLHAGPERQQVMLESGDVIDARLIVVATGMGDALRHKVGIRRRVVVEKQSLSVGFTMVPGAGETFDFPALTYYGERVADRIDYLSLFPIGATMRANLFTFRDHRDPWIRALRQEPKATLLAALPGLKPFLGDFRVIDKVQNWLMDLTVAEDFRRDGVVLIGDAFQTSCPAAGTGVSRLLADVDRLCNVHLPHWLATPGMNADKIAQFYDDPVKQAADARASRLAHYRRALTIKTGLYWTMRRQQLYLRRRALAWIDQRSPAWAARLAALRTGKRWVAGKLGSHG